MLATTRANIGITRGLRIAALAISAGSIFMTLGQEQISHSVNGDSEIWSIDQPKINQPITNYPQISFRPGDRIVIDAGGCAQHGGGGLTWTRYLDPYGPGS
jgi:hypothetical protein